MRSIFNMLIADFHERELPELMKRDSILSILQGKVATVIGMRRSGKTYFLYQTMADLLTTGITKEALLYINFEDERIMPLSASKLHMIPDSYYQTFPHLKDQACYFFFDEIQNVPGWETFIRRLLDTETIQIFLTGSSAKLLSKEIATSLRGRSLTTEIFPYTFKEGLRQREIQIKGSFPGARQRSFIINYFHDYLLTGGFPEVQRFEPIDRINTLQEYVRTVIYRDIVERHNIRNVHALKRLIDSILKAPATLFSVNKFYNHLKSIQVPCRKDNLYAYVSFLHDAYLIFPVNLYARSEKARQVNPAKIYAVDTGLIHAHSQWPEPDWGHLLENFVYLELRKRRLQISYYKTKSGKEVDFIAIDPITGNTILIQVSFSLHDPKTRKREVGALSQAMGEIRFSSAIIVTANDEDHVKTENGSIEIVPAWLWAIQLDAGLEEDRQRLKSIEMPDI